jgi:MFS family permease
MSAIVAPIVGKDERYPTANLAWYLVGVLVIANILSFVDRQILGLLVQPIRADLGISDTQISLLQGFAFSILYSILGLPLGRYADRANRRNLIIVGIGIWSLMTMACGLASTYGELFAARIGVGIGEATLAPAAFSMICDAFRRERRGTALGIYSSAIYLGIGVSVALGGVVLALIRGAAEVELPLFGLVRSWQAAFICVGAPGFVVALLMLTVREPSRQGGLREQPPISQAADYLKQNRRAFILQLLGYSLIALAAYGLGSWVPTFFIRTHQWSAAQAGISYGLTLTFAGTFGGVVGGLIGDRWRNAGRADARLLVSVVAAVVWMPFILIGVFVDDPWIALAMLGIASCFSSMVNGLGPTTVQDIVPDWLRGQATAIYFFVINLLGLGIGPTAVALVTDRVYGADSALRLSLATVTIPAILIGIALLLAARTPYQRTTAALAAPPPTGE